MPQRQHLGLLQVGVAGERLGRLRLGYVHQDRDDPAQGRANLFPAIAAKQAQVGGYLVVAAAAGVQLIRHGADQFLQAALDSHVDILIVVAESELAGGQFLPYALQPTADGQQFAG